MSHREIGKRMPIFVLALLVMLMGASGVFAASYYVSPTGSNTNAGTQAAPFKTIAQGLSKLQAGDTLNIMSGTYNEGNVIQTLNGTASAPITIKGAPGSKINVVGQDGFLLTGNVGYIIFDGLEISGGSRAGILASYGAHHITIRNCHIHNGYVWQIQSTRASNITVENCHLYGAVQQHGIYFASTEYAIARNNRIHDNARAGIHCNGDVNDGGDGVNTSPIFENNIIYNCGAGGAAGINMDGSEFAFIANNLIFNNKAGGINSYAYSGSRAGLRNRILNNTVYFPPGSSGRYGLQLINGSREAEVKNNIFVCGRPVLDIDSSSMSGLKSDYNIWYRHGSTASVSLDETWITFADWKSRSGQDSHSLTVLPTFVNAAGGDFRLASGSAGIDQGVALADVTKDMNGSARPQGSAYDIGCYESGSSGTPTSTTTSTTLPAGTAIVDNRDNSTNLYWRAISGSWVVNNTGTSRWPTTDLAANYVYAYPSSTSNASGEWVCKTLAAGTYEVYAWWPMFGYYMSSTVPYEVVHANGTTTVRVDQNKNGGQWNLLGTFSFNANSHVVRINNGGTLPGQYLVGDAVKFVKSGTAITTTTVAPTTTTTVAPTTTTTLPSTTTTTLPSGSAIVDNVDSGFSVLSGTMSVNNGGANRYGDNYRWAYCTTGAETARAQYRVTTLPAGNYEVSAWWPNFTFSMGSSVAYEVRHADGISTVRVNQGANGGKWNSLGVYRFNAGSHDVQIHNGGSTGQYMVADAVRFATSSSQVTTTTVAPTTTTTVAPTTTTSATVPSTTTTTTTLPGTGRHFYVSLTGNDANAGSNAAPFKTINKGISVLRAGDTLHIKAGTYSESYEGYDLAGTASAPIRITGEQGTIIQGPTNKIDAFLFWDAQYVIVENMEMRGFKRAGVLFNNGQYVTVRNCHIHDNYVWQIQTTGGHHATVENCHLYGAGEQHGIYFSGTDYPIARNNIIHDNVRAGIHCNGGGGVNTAPIFENNIIYNNGSQGAAGINMDATELATIRNNLIYNNLAGGITAYATTELGRVAGKGHKIENNTVYFKSGGRYGLQLIAGSANSTVRNNIFVCGNEALEIDSASLSGLVSDNNVWVRLNSTSPISLDGSALSLASWRSQTGRDAKSFSTMPAFVNAAGNDFHMKPVCFTVDSGATISGLTKDLDGVARPQGAGFDLGAYECLTSGGTTTTTTVPTNNTGSVIIDNVDANTEKAFKILSGTWSINNGGTNRYGTDYHWATGQTGAETARAQWKCVTLPAGEYEVSAWWANFTYSMGSNVAYEVHHADGISTVRVNQGANGGKWNSLGTYRFNAGSHVVQISNGGTPGLYVVADAVMFAPVASSSTTTSTTSTTVAAPATTTTTLPVQSATTMVIDDKDRLAESSYIWLGGAAWRQNNVATGMWPQADVNATYRYTDTTSSTATARSVWQNTSLSAGQYEVFAWWPQFSQYAMGTATYEVVHADGETAKRFSQASNGGQWVSLGTYRFNAGAHAVRITNANSQPGSYIVADAVKFVRVGN